MLACASWVCSVPVCLFSSPSTADTKFPFLSQQREWKEGKPAGHPPEGVGREAPQFRCPGTSSQPRSGARLPPQPPQPAAIAGGGTGQPWAVGQPAGVKSLGPLQPPGMWGPPGSLCGSWHCPPEEPWGRMGVLELGPVPTTAFLPRLSESPGPTPCTSGGPCGERPRLPLPRLGH